MDSVGAEINAYTSKEETWIYSSFVKEHFERATELIADICFNSIFPEKEIKKEKDVIIDEINAYQDSPSEQIFDDFEEVLFANHPLGRNILGTEESVNSFTRDNIFSFIHRRYRTDQMVFSVVGDFNNWEPGVHPMHLVGSSGIWAGFVPGLKNGDLYKFHIISNHGGYHVAKSDPFAFAMEIAPRTASALCNLSYAWNKAVTNDKLWHSPPWIMRGSAPQIPQPPTISAHLRDPAWTRMPKAMVVERHVVVAGRIMVP